LKHFRKEEQYFAFATVLLLKNPNTKSDQFTFFKKLDKPNNECKSVA